MIEVYSRQRDGVYVRRTGVVERIADGGANFWLTDFDVTLVNGRLRSCYVRQLVQVDRSYADGIAKNYDLTFELQDGTDYKMAQE